MEAILQLEHLRKQYGAHRAVDDVSFSIPAGSIFGLLGPNGAGKTTLLRMITGIFYPDEGRIYFNGAEFDPSRDTVQIGYMPEERGLYKKMKVGEHILYLARLKGIREREARTRAQHWVRKFGLAEWWNKKIGDLSKGMQQKVQFIATILHEPKLLILDEPFSGLDPINTNLIKDEIFSLREKGTTVIFSTHRMEQVEEICDDIVLMNKGRKVLDGAVRQIKQDFKRSEFSLTLSDPPDGSPVTSDAFIVEQIKGPQVIVKLREGCSTNDVLDYFIRQKMEIHAFNEILPTINEVFIRQVEHTEAPVVS